MVAANKIFDNLTSSVLDHLSQFFQLLCFFNSFYPNLISSAANKYPFSNLHEQKSKNYWFKCCCYFFVLLVMQKVPKMESINIQSDCEMSREQSHPVCLQWKSMKRQRALIHRMITNQQVKNEQIKRKNLFFCKNDYIPRKGNNDNKKYFLEKPSITMIIA